MLETAGVPSTKAQERLRRRPYSAPLCILLTNKMPSCMFFPIPTVRARRCEVPKQSPIPDQLDKPFWDACNEGRLVIQHCKRCNRLQHPPEPTCAQCGSVDNLEWR